MNYTFYKDLKLSNIALGTALFGSSISEEEAFKYFDYYVSKGGNIFDTARVYADWLENGHSKSEQTVGNYIKSRGIRDRIIISTKGGHPRFESMHTSRLSEEELTSDLTESLEALQTDYIDIYFLHRDDENIPVKKIMDILNKFVKEGKVRHLGTSNWRMDRILEANKYAEENGLAKFEFSQIMHSFARINDGAPIDETLVYMNEEEYKKYCENDILLFAYSSQAQGFYTKLEKGIDNLNDYFKGTYLNEENLERFKLLKEVNCEVSTTSIATKVLESYKKFKIIPIIGTHSLEMLDDSLRGEDISEENINKLVSKLTY